jgi:dTDP-4-dehydrorhamnose reductase
MKRMMIIGGSGLLGSHLVNRAKNEYEVVATFNGHSIEIEKARSIPLDITDQEETENMVNQEKPDFIILSAAQRNVDFCEKNPEIANKVNIEGARNVAKAAEIIQTKLVYLSTDLVFDGEKESYLEGDDTNPINHYGMTKLGGEIEVQDACGDYAIARVSVLYDWNLYEHNTNFIAWILDNLKKGKPLALFTDQFRNATYVKNACDALIAICKKDEKGIFHVAGKRCVDRHYMGKKVAEIFDFDFDLITTTTSEESDWQAKRPKKCCLVPDKMENVLGVKSISLEEGLLAMKTEMDNSAK